MKNINVSGNIQSISGGKNYAQSNDATMCFEMFKNCKYWTFNGLSLPAKNVISGFKYNKAAGCYESMFEGCTNLTNIPDGFLPATIVGSNVYAGMFKDCTGLTNIPENLLPATTLKGTDSRAGTYSLVGGYSGCYESMFEGCINLTNIPDGFLPGFTNTVNNNNSVACYRSMFKGCTGLTNIPENLLPMKDLFSA